MVRLVFFGKLADIAGSSQRDVQNHASLGDLLHHLKATEPELYAALHDKGVRCALNLALLPKGEDTPLSDNDELAFMPAFSGG
jgi:molybdopterin converting factor small subunit